MLTTLAIHAKEINLPSQPIVFSCHENDVKSDFGTVDVRIQVVKKGDLFVSTMALLKNEKFISAYKQESWIWKMNEGNLYLPYGDLILLGEDGTELPWEGAAINIIQSTDPLLGGLVIVTLGSQTNSNILGFFTKKCHGSPSTPYL